MADSSIEHLTRRIGRMRRIGCLADWELRSAVYRAHRQGAPVAELADAAELDATRIGGILRDFDPAELPDDDEPELDWADMSGSAILISNR